MDLRRFLREPLLHFVVLGALLFAADRGRRAQAPRANVAPASSSAAPDARIVVTPEVKRALVEEFGRAYGHPPSSQETATLIEGWIDEEVLYREGVAHKFEREDPAVRRRVAQQMSFVLESGTAPPDPGDAELRAWFSAHPERFKRSQLVDFTQVYVEGSSVAASDRASALLVQLRGGADPSGLGDLFPGGRRYRGRKLEDLAEAFGGDFTKGMGDQKDGTWELRRSRFGHHLVRIDGHSAAATPDFAAVRDEVKYDWLKTRRAELHAAAIADLRKRWTIETAP